VLHWTLNPQVSAIRRTGPFQTTVSRTRPRKSNVAPQPLGDVLSHYLDKSGLGAKVEAASVLTDWAERVGPGIAAVTTACGLQDQTLFVSVANSAWMMELNLMKHELIKRVNSGRKEGQIRQIVFQMAA
jgi:predicted nucleic acid-binding Zn ribbon protein